MSCVVTNADKHDDTSFEPSSSELGSANERRELFSRSALSLIDQVIVSASTFLTMFLVSRNSSKAEVGAFALALTVVNFVRTLQERSIAAPYLAFTFHSGFNRRTFKGSNFVHQGILASTTALLILVAVAIGWSLDFSFTLLAIIGSLAITLPLTLVRDQIRAISAASFQFGTQLVLDVAVGVTQLAAILVLIWANRLSIPLVNIALGLSCLIPAVIWFWVAWPSMAFERTAVISDWKHNWRYSRWLVGARVFGIFGYIAVPWMVVYYLDEAATGAFAVCNSLVGISLMFVTGLNNLFQPRTIRELQRSGIPGMKRTLAESILIIASLLSVISLGFSLFGTFALETLFGPAYREYGNIAFLMSLSTLSVSFSVLFGNGLAALGNSREYFWGEFACCAFSVTAAIFLIPAWGLAGAAGALIFGGLGASVVTGLTLARAIKRRAINDRAGSDRVGGDHVGCDHLTSESMR